MNKALLFLAFSFTLITVQAQNKVIVIGIDGLNTIDLPIARTPAIDRMAIYGSYTFKAEAVVPTSSNQNWSSMLKGADIDKHGMWAYTKPESGCDQSDFWPNVFSELKAQKPEAKTACFYQWPGFKKLFEKESFDSWDNTFAGPGVTFNKAKRYFAKHQPELLFLHINSPDHHGHKHGHGSANYIETVERIDAMLFKFLLELKTEGLLKDTYVILTSDHGGIDYGHGGTEIESIRIPWFITGPDIRPAHEINEQIKTYDTSCVIAGLLNFDMPDCWECKTIDEIFVKP